MLRPSTYAASALHGRGVRTACTDGRCCTGSRDDSHADLQSLGEQTLNTGSLAWSACTALAYWYVVSPSHNYTLPQH